MGHANPSEQGLEIRPGSQRDERRLDGKKHDAALFLLEERVEMRHRVVGSTELRKHARVVVVDHRRHRR